MPLPKDTIEFAAYHQPALLDGRYVLEVEQQVQIDGATVQWTDAPSTKLYFSVAGPRFSLDPGLIQSQFPPPKSIGQYYNVLPHIIFNRTTLPWERTIDNSSPSTTKNPTPWMALLLFDQAADKCAPKVTTVTLTDLRKDYRDSSAPPNKPEFVRLLDEDDLPLVNAQEAWLKLEIGQHLNDRLTVIDVPRPLLWQILPSAKEIAWLSHVREGLDHFGNKAGYPVIFCNRLPAPGTLGAGGSGPLGTQSTVHLVSLEGRQPLLLALDALPTRPADNTTEVRFVSLASWSFATFQANRTFTGWLKEAWSTGAPAGHTLRMPARGNSDADRFLSQGYAPIPHQTRQGNHLVSWYRSPLLPGPSPAADLALPVRMSDQLVRYFKDVGMFDATYAAAWELGRLLTLRSKKVSVSLFNWKRAHAQQAHQAERAARHLPFAPDYGIAPGFPDIASEWFKDLLLLRHVPFHYLVPREEMLPANALRFFHVDNNWLECLLDGAFSVGRVSSADLGRDGTARDAGHVPKASVYSGFLLRSPVVAGWPHLGVQAYTQAFDDDQEHDVSPAKRLRFDRLGKDVLLCLFEHDIDKGEIKTVDIHEHPDTIHFGVHSGDDPMRIDGYKKQLRNKDTGKQNDSMTSLGWKHNSTDWRTLDIALLAGAAQAGNSAEFGVTMIEGVEKVRFTARSV